MSESVKIRPARKGDCRAIAELYSIASDGVADYIWSRHAKPGEDLLDVGERRYGQEDTAFSYKNCAVAEQGGRVIGMLVAFPMAAAESKPNKSEHVDPVLKPYAELEQPDSYYVCGVALYPEFRGQGLGSRFMELAEIQACEKGLRQLSLLVFDQNKGAKRLYERLAYYEVTRAAVVPHPLIHMAGDVLLMVKDL